MTRHNIIIISTITSRSLAQFSRPCGTGLHRFVSSSKSSETPTKVTTSSSNKTKVTDSKLHSNKASKDAAAATTSTIDAPPKSASSSWIQQLQSVWKESSGEAELADLKQVVVDKSRQFDNAVRDMEKKRELIQQRQRQHEEAYKAHATILMKRDQWGENEAAAFVKVSAEEVQTRQALRQAKHDLAASEELASRTQRDYMDAMRRRYHEEQVWQERWRLLGTFGTWSLIGLNTCVFLVGQYIYQRREAMRLRAIEDILHDKLNRKQEGASQALVASEVKAVVASEVKALLMALSEEKALAETSGEKELEEEDAVTEPEDEEEGMEESDNQEDASPIMLHYKRLKKRVQRLNREDFHVPSAVAGAVVAASAYFCLSLLGSGRR